jgi:hypothetical protein
MPVTIAVSILALALGLLNVSWRSPAGGPAGATMITVVGVPAGRAIPAGFLGLSLEFASIEPYAGVDPAALDPVFEQLIRNLTPGQKPVLRIGGDSADSSWWPVPGITRPPGVAYTLTPDWLRVAGALERALGARLILGLNLEADNPTLAAAEAGALIGGIGPGAVTALELGNEPELYGTFAWYRTADGRGIPGRSRGYDFRAFTNDFTRFARVLRNIAVAGPTTGGLGWRRYLDQFLTTEPWVKLVAVHRYPLQLCFTKRNSPRFPTIGHLLTAAASTGLADGFAREVAIAHARGLPLRVDELNTVSCGGDSAVSDTFASALWALDTLFELARVGVDGVNMHTYPGAGYELFRISRVNGRWRAAIAPEYYGLLMFAQAAPIGSRLLRLSGATAGLLKSWGTRAPDGTIRIILINKDVARTRVAVVRVPGTPAAATLMRLRAPSIAANAGVTFGGQSFDAETDSGTLQGVTGADAVKPSHSEYVISLPPASAAMLTIPTRHR